MGKPWNLKPFLGGIQHSRLSYADSRALQRTSAEFGEELTNFPGTSVALEVQSLRPFCLAHLIRKNSSV